MCASISLSSFPSSYSNSISSAVIRPAMASNGLLPVTTIPTNTHFFFIYMYCLKNNAKETVSAALHGPRQASYARSHHCIRYRAACDKIFSLEAFNRVALGVPTRFIAPLRNRFFQMILSLLHLFSSCLERTTKKQEDSTKIIASNSSNLLIASIRRDE